MSTAAIRQKLHHYIETAQDKKIKALFTMVGDEIEETYDRWNDDAFVTELQRREANYLKGATKTYTMEQTISRARQFIKRNKKK